MTSAFRVLITPHFERLFRKLEDERDVRYAELGRYLCEVRDREHWRLENGRHNFEEYVARKFPGSRRKAYYLMSIHDHLRRYP